MARKTQYPPNDLKRRERTRKGAKCQWCEDKVPLKQQFVVYNDLDAGKVIKTKDASRPSAEGKSHYCGECAEKRVRLQEAYLARRENGGGSKPKKAKAKAKAKPKSKAKAKAKPKAKAKKAVKPKKAAAKKEPLGADPF